MTNKTFTTNRLVVIAALLGAVIFGCINIIGAQMLRGVRVDLTQQKLYSLCDGTRAMVGALAEPIRFRFFMSSGLTREAPQIAAFASRVRAMLDSYVAGSGGKIILEVIDPKPYSEEEDRAVAFGVSPIRSGSGDRLFFGLAATNSTTGKATIGSFSPEREAFLEYDLTRLVAELDRKGKAVVALMDGLNLQGNPQMGTREQQVLTQMKQFFDVKMVEPEPSKLPEATRVLMVVHPQGLSEKTLYLIDQWVMGGGATMVFVDPNAENQMGPRGAPPPDASSNLEKLFAAWGVRYDPKRAVADPAFALQTERMINGRPTPMSNLPGIAVRDEGLRKDDVPVAEFRKEYGDVSVIPTPAYYYGLPQKEEINVHLEEGKTLFVRLVNLTDPDQNGQQTAIFELNGYPRHTTVTNKILAKEVVTRAKADPADATQVGAPMPGMVASIAVTLGQKVKEGETLLTLEAMKMFAAISSPGTGTVQEICAKVGESVESKDLLIRLKK